MHYEKDEQGRLVITAISVAENTVINAIIAAIEAYRKTLGATEAKPDH